MLEGQDNRKLAGAKEALKKKILRLVMQEAMEELGDAEALATKSVEEIGVDPADMELLQQGVRKHLIRKAAQEVTQVDLEELSSAAAQAALDNSEMDEAAGRVERQLLAVISEKAMEGLSEDGSTVQKSFENISESNAGAMDALAESVKEKLCAAVAAKAWSNGVDPDRVVEMAADRIDSENPSVAEAIERIQASAGDLILHTVLAQLTGKEATAELAEEVSRRFKERMMGVVTERVSADPDQIAEELAKEFGPQHEAVVAAARKTRGHLLGQIQEKALASVSDARAVAREAFLEISDDEANIAEAANALTRRITQDIADRALEQLGDSETAAASALKIARDSEQVIVTASNSVYETMARHVAEDARERCSDADHLADAARDYMDPKDGSISRAVSIVQTRLSEMVASRALAALEEDDRMRDLAREAAKKQSAVVENSVAEIREQIMDDIVYRVGETFLDAGDTARRAKARMGEGNAAVIAASEVLKELVLEDLAKQATFTLLEPEKTGAKAFERIDVDDPRFQKTADNVKERLIKTIAEHSLQTISESDDAADRARQHISDTDAAIVSATAVLRDHLITEIAQRGTDELHDTRAVAQQSRGRIEADNKNIALASKALRTLLIEDMVRMTRAALEDVETAAHEAMSQLDPSDEVFDRIRAVFKERVLINVLGEAMREIGQSVSAPNQEAAMFQQALHAMGERESGRAGAWNGTGYQPKPAPAPETNRPARRSAEEVTAESPGITVDDPSGGGGVAALPDEWGADSHAGPTPDPAVVAPAASYTTVNSRFAPQAEAVEMDDWSTAASESAVELPASSGWVRLSDIEDPDRVVVLDPPEPLEDMIVTEFVDHEDARPRGQVPSRIKFEVTLDGKPAEWPRKHADVVDTEVTKGAGPDTDSSDRDPAGFSYESRSSVPKERPQRPAAATHEAKPVDQDAASLDMTWDADDSHRCYVYGYVSASEIASTPPADLEAITPDQPIRFVTLRGVRAIVSKVSAREYGEETLPERSKDAEWVKSQIRRHASVLDGFKSSGTVMPVRFGSVYENEAGVAVMMSAEYDHVVETLDRLKDKQEWSLRMTRDSDRLGVKIASSGRTVEDSLDAISTGVAQFIKDEMGKAGELVDDEILATVTENCIRRTHDALMPWAVDGAQKALVTAPGVDMVFNAAYLVESAQMSDFKEEIERLSKEMEPLGMTLDLTGPWPAYHFVDSDEDGAAELVTVAG